MQLERHLIQPKATKRFSWGPEAPRGRGAPHVLRMTQGQLPGRLRGAPPVEKAHVYLPEERHTPHGHHAAAGNELLLLNADALA